VPPDQVFALAQRLMDTSLSVPASRAEDRRADADVGRT